MKGTTVILVIGGGVVAFVLFKKQLTPFFDKLKMQFQTQPPMTMPTPAKVKPPRNTNQPTIQPVSYQPPLGRKIPPGMACFRGLCTQLPDTGTIYI